MLVADERRKHGCGASRKAKVELAFVSKLHVARHALLDLLGSPCSVGVAGDSNRVVFAWMGECAVGFAVDEQV